MKGLLDAEDGTAKEMSDGSRQGGDGAAQQQQQQNGEGEVEGEEAIDLTMAMLRSADSELDAEWPTARALLLATSGVPGVDVISDARSKGMVNKAI